MRKCFLVLANLSCASHFNTKKQFIGVGWGVQRKVQLKISLVVKIQVTCGCVLSAHSLKIIHFTGEGGEVREL